MSEIDTEFKALVNGINRQIQIATEALSTANQLAKQAKLPGLILSCWMADELDVQDYDDDTSPSEIMKERMAPIDVSVLETEMNIAGWSTSSAYC